jgi:energy-coupling factor transporter ATP-binding protein EcfA2
MSTKLDVEIYYKNSNSEINSYGFPEPLRCLIVGASGSGKTTLMLNFIFKDWIKFNRVIIYSTTLHQKTYQDLAQAQAKLNEQNKGFFKGWSKVGPIQKPFIEFYGEVKPIEEVEGDDILVVFDDLVLEKQKEIGKYFVVGRHRGFHCLFLSQNYGKVARQTIKSNLNYLFLFKQPHFYLKQIHEDFKADTSFTSFTEECETEWKVGGAEQHNFAKFLL